MNLQTRTSHFSSARGPVRRAALPVAIVAVSLFSGCIRRPIIVQAPPPTVINAAAAPMPTGRDVVIVHEAPPAPRQEAMSAQPSPEKTWVPGYWSWADGKYSWVTGHWESPPTPGAVWVAPRWEQRSDGYAFIPGGWR
jgi:hypothetical protein